MAVFLAWRTATLAPTTKKRIPALSRLLRKRKQPSAADQAQLRSDMAAAEAEFARMEADARATKEPDDGS